MKLSLVLTINNRTPEVSRAVADSFRLLGNAVDEAVIVLDRPTPEARLGAEEAYSWIPATFVEIDGPQGWVCPARAWNAGFAAATGNLLYTISSEVVQEAGNVARARGLAAANPNTVIFGACHNSTPETLVVGAEPGLLVSTRMPRPLGFIACYPAEAVKRIGGFDETYMDGLWYDDDDFHIRLWNAGLDFLFTDAIHGVHLNHERPVLSSPEGQRRIALNAATMTRKHGTLSPWAALPRIAQYNTTARTLRWKHA